ncbi:MAG: hypothetical protein AAF431_20080 [Pseudomonadota bacterium]
MDQFFGGTPKELENAKVEVNSLVGIDTYSEEEILSYANKSRAVLHGEALEEVGVPPKN